MTTLTTTVATALAALALPALLSAQTGSYKMSAVDTAHGDREFELLWPNGAPGALGAEPIDKPKITLYRAGTNANGAAVVVCPGGGYGVVAADHEGRQVAEWLNSFGVSAFVLQYRLGPRYHHPAPLQDAQRAIRIVRSRAKEWSVDPTRIGILGFSAGGHLTSTAATHFDAGQATAADPVDRVVVAAGLRGPALPRDLVRRPGDPRGLPAQPARRSARPEARGVAEQRETGDGADAAQLPLPHGRRRRGAGRELAPVLPGAEGGRCAGGVARLRARPPRRRAGEGRPGALAVAWVVRAVDEGARPAGAEAVAPEAQAIGLVVGARPLRRIAVGPAGR